MMRFAGNARYLTWIATWLLAACSDPAPTAAEPRIVYSTKTGAETCVRMAEQAYCFLNANIDEKNFATDAAAGFLFRIPIDSPEIAKCNEQWNASHQKTFPYTHFQAGVGEPFPNDTAHAYFERIRELRVGESNSDLLRPLQRIRLYGLNCYRYKPDAVYKYDAMCEGGGVTPTFFLHCLRDDSVPFPSCQSQFVYNGLQFNISFSKRCAPYHDQMRRRVMEFIDEGRRRSAI